MAKTSGKPKAGTEKKKEIVKKAGRKLHLLYTSSGEKIQRKNKICPKCGPGMFLGKHAKRLVCGKCAYVEFVKGE